MKPRICGPVIVFVCLLFTSVSFGAVIIVPTDYSTIQSAIDAASTGDTVRVLDGVYSGIGNRDISFSGKAITVESVSGPGTCIIDCLLAGRGFIFQTSETSSSILQGFTIRYGRFSGSRGGGIYCSGASPTINNCIITQCESSSGGGIGLYGAASPAITDCTITNCTCSNYGGGVVIYGTSTNYANPIFTNCTISGNSSSFQGGGFYSRYCNINVTGGSVSSNTATDEGGGFYLDTNTTAVISGITIDSNTAQSSEFGKGGGLYIACSGSYTATITDCSITHNTANCGVITSGGGGIACISGIQTIKRCLFSGNFTRSAGGAIYVFQNQLTIGGVAGDGNTFADNLAGAGCDLASRIAGSYNARYNTFAGYYPSDYYVSPAGSFDLTGCTSLLTPITQDLYVTSTGSDSNDGLTWGTAFRTVQHALSQIYASVSNPLTIHVAAGNYSSPLTGERFPLPLVNYVSIVGEDMDTSFFDADDAAAGLVGYLDNNISISGLTIRDGDCYYGGGCALYNSSPAISSCRFTENTGGTLNCSYSSPTISDCLFENNSSTGISIRDYSNPVITNCESSGNSTGIQISYQSQSLIDQCLIENNDTGIYISSSVPEIRNCSIIGNTSLYGGIYCAGGSSTGIVITGCLIEGNSGNAVSGSGLSFINVSSPSILSYCTISSNSTSLNGTVFISNSEIAIDNCLLINNLAQDGGGIRIVTSNANLNNCTIASNTVSGDGGAIYSYGSNISLHNSILWNNTAAGSGDAIMLENSIASTLNVDYCDIQGGTSEIHLDSSSTLNWGAGNLDENPLFVAGTLGGYYLSHIDSGQAADSPCRNAGSDDAAAIQVRMPQGMTGMDQLTVRTDHIADAYTVDIGYHYWDSDIIIPTPYPTNTPTETPTITLTPTDSPTFSETPTSTETPTTSPSPLETATPPPTQTPTETHIPTSTPTSAPSISPTVTPTATSTPGPVPATSPAGLIFMLVMFGLVLLKFIRPDFKRSQR